MEFDGKKIVVTGGKGFLGSRVVEILEKKYLVKAADITIPRSKNVDLRIFENAKDLLKNKDIVINLAANVGGIGYNQKFPGTLFYDNLMIGANILESARLNDVGKIVQVGTVCSYPKIVDVPFKESDLWNGYPEETNAPYGIAKKALFVMGEAYSKQYSINVINLIPVNLYGPGDNFNEERSHVIPALIKKFTEASSVNAESVTLWGTGRASREFLYVDDAANGIVLASLNYNEVAPVNIGTGKEISISELAKLIAKIVGFNGLIQWDTTRPDGQPRRCLDVSKAFHYFGFKASTKLEDGLSKTVDWYLNHHNDIM